MRHYHEGRPALKVSDTARAVAAEVAPLTREATGNVSTGDACFLLSLLELERPMHILELGVASGTSTLMMLRMMDAVVPRATLDSVDLADAYYADPTKPVGYLVTEHSPAAPANWRLATGAGAMNLAAHPRLVGTPMARHYHLTFIDAHHGHPWPTLDALCLLPYVVPYSFVAFHDINLPLLGDYPYHGAVHVLRDWPREVLISDDAPVPNIGAIQLSDAAVRDAASLIPMLRHEWDCGIHPFHAERILAHLERTLVPYQFAAVNVAFEENAHLPSD
jgi:hypothetical protein